MPLSRFEKLEHSRQKSILAAAAQEFSEHGFEHASYNRIITLAGLSKGAMYYYFADKDDLYRTVLEVAITLWFEQVGFAFEADDSASFWRACEDMYDRSLRFMMADPRNAALCLSVSKAREHLEGHPLLLELHEKMLAWTNELIDRGQRCGAVRKDLPPGLLVHMALSMMEAGDRWLAVRWNELTESDIAGTAKMMVGIFYRLGSPEVKNHE